MMLRRDDVQEGWGFRDCLRFMEGWGSGGMGFREGWGSGRIGVQGGMRFRKDRSFREVWRFMERWGLRE